MREEELPVPLEARGVAVVDGDERRVGSQPACELRRHLGALGAAPSLDGEEQETRRGTRAQLLDEELLGCGGTARQKRSEEHTSELQSHSDLVCRLLLEKKNKANK